MFKYVLLALVAVVDASHHHKHESHHHGSHGAASGASSKTLVSPGNMASTLTAQTNGTAAGCGGFTGCHGCVSNLCSWGTASKNAATNTCFGKPAKGVAIQDWLAKEANQCTDSLNLCQSTGNFTAATTESTHYNHWNVTNNDDFSIGWNKAAVQTTIIPQDYFCSYNLNINNDNFVMNQTNVMGTGFTLNTNVYMSISHKSIDIKKLGKKGKVDSKVATTYWRPYDIAESSDKLGFLIGPSLTEFQVVFINLKNQTIAEAQKDFSLDFKSLSNAKFALLAAQQNPGALIAVILLLVCCCGIFAIIWKFFRYVLCCGNKNTEDDDFNRHKE